jgi:hypothetical protein
MIDKFKPSRSELCEDYIASDLGTAKWIYSNG